MLYENIFQSKMNIVTELPVVYQNIHIIYIKYILPKAIVAFGYFRMVYILYVAVVTAFCQNKFNIKNPYNQ